MLETALPQPWYSFLAELDRTIGEPLRLDCMGGFVMTMLYGLDRATADVDVLEAAPHSLANRILQLGAMGGELSRKHRVYLEKVSIAAVPENYEKRLTEMFPGALKNIRLMALDPYDLALSKLERNVRKDRDDIRHLARSIPLDLRVLSERYYTELRWQLGNPEREDLTLKLWIDAIEEERNS
jgi:Nucleotidyltransferase of unknown function (DUF6036)